MRKRYDDTFTEKEIALIEEVIKVSIKRKDLSTRKELFDVLDGKTRKL